MKTQKALTPISVIAPRELCTDGKNVYVSSYTGEVSKIDTLSLQVILKSDVVGANLEGIAYRQGYIYVCNAWNNDYTYNTNLVKLNAETLQKVTDIQVVANPNQLIADGDELFLASWGNYIDITGTIQHIALNDFVTKMAHATYMAYSERSKHLYLIGIAYDENWNENYTYTVCGWRSDRQEALEGEFIKGDEIQSPCAIGVDPVTRDVFISSRKKYPNAEGVMTVSYSQDGYVARYTTNGTYVGSYDCGVNPGTLLFVSHQELQPESD